MVAKDTKITGKELVLAILEALPPAKASKYFVCKLAYLSEFTYVHRYEKELSDLDFAALPHGPAIDDYEDLFDRMEEDGFIKQEGKFLHIIKKAELENGDIADFITEIVNRYKDLNFGAMEALTHETDSYKITTNNERDGFGQKIDKNLAYLETFLDDESDEGSSIDESLLVEPDLDNAVEYEMG